MSGAGTIRGGILWLFSAIALAAPFRADADALDAPFVIRRAGGAITVDGDLSDPGWKDAARTDSFVEIRPGDNVAPSVKTTLLLAYDERFLYVAFDCEDPDPSRIRAPFSSRDDVGVDQDYAGVFIDSRYDHRTVFEFFANARGAQYDAVQDDATGNEDASPDFYWDARGRIGPRGWTLEMRIPFSSLRYGGGDLQTWGLIALRNFSRGDRYELFTSRIPRGNNCFVCHERDLVGLSGLPSGAHFVAAPYATASDEWQAAGEPSDGTLLRSPVRGNAGIDAKWLPGANTAVDATLNPDFSQIESDVAQIAVNSRFALFYPEKRPFFLEGQDLFSTPIPAVYTRTITSPRWGLRTTSKVGPTAYTVLVAQDRGGGSVILPGPDSSVFAPQDFESFAAIGRARRDFGRSFGSVLLTDREIRGGGYNRVAGPDFQWNPGDDDQVTGQYLWSRTRNPDRPDLSPEWNGQTFSSHALQVAWSHSTRTLAWALEYQDFGDGFRADNGFVPQAGYRRGRAEVSYRFFPTGFFSQLAPVAVADDAWDVSGRTILRRLSPGVRFRGKKGASGEIDLLVDRVRAGGNLFDRRQVTYSVSLNPSRLLARLAVDGFLGQDVDFVNVRPGRGGLVNLGADLRATDRFALQLNLSRQWLDVAANASSPPTARLFTAQVERLRLTYYFGIRTFVRAVAEYVATDRDPTLYEVPVARRDGALAATLLLSHQWNWQTVLFAGFGDSRSLNGRYDLVHTGREVFLKVSYAFQR